MNKAFWIIVALLALWVFACQWTGTCNAQEVTITAAVPERYQDFANQYCIPGEMLCVHWIPSDFEASYCGTKPEIEALDLVTGQFMTTRWISEDIMETIIYQDGYVTSRWTGLPVQAEPAAP